MLLLGGDIREDDLAILQTKLLGSNVDICLTNLGNITSSKVGKNLMHFPHLRESQKPHDAVGDSVQNIDPHLQGAEVNPVNLVEVAEDHCVLWQHVLLPRGHQDLLGDLLTGGLG